MGGCAFELRGTDGVFCVCFYFFGEDTYNGYWDRYTDKRSAVGEVRRAYVVIGWAPFAPNTSHTDNRVQ